MSHLLRISIFTKFPFHFVLFLFTTSEYSKHKVRFEIIINCFILFVYYFGYYYQLHLKPHL